MSIQIEKLPEIRTIYYTLSEPVELPGDPATSMAATAQFKQELSGEGKVYRVLDFSDVNLGFGDMMVGIAMEREHEGGAFDPDVATIYIGKSELVKLGANALKSQNQFQGSNVIGVVETREEALDLIRKHLSQ